MNDLIRGVNECLRKKLYFLVYINGIKTVETAARRIRSGSNFQITYNIIFLFLT